MTQTPTPTATAMPCVDLGSAGNYAVLAGQSIVNTGLTSLCGSIGIEPLKLNYGFDANDDDLRGGDGCDDAAASQPN